MKEPSMEERLRVLVNTCGRGLYEIARDARVATCSMYAFSKGKTIKLSTAERLFDYFGLELCEKDKSTQG